MAYVRREHNAPGTVLIFDGGTATVVDDGAKKSAL
jgi:pantothenate kinase type III